MARKVRTSLPDDEYLLLIGQFAYMVTSLEGLLLFDLPRLEPFLPGQPDLRDLASVSVFEIGERLVSLSKKVRDEAVKEYLRTGGEYLIEIAPIRNQVLHARPATIDGEQMLYRWNPKKGEVLNVPKSWLEAQIDRVDKMNVQLNGIRP